VTEPHANEKHNAAEHIFVVQCVRVGNHNARLGRVFNRELGLAALTADAAYCARQVVALERFDCGREIERGKQSTCEDENKTPGMPRYRKIQYNKETDTRKRGGLKEQ
jgi:hypothetical protein